MVSGCRTSPGSTPVTRGPGIDPGDSMTSHVHRLSVGVGTQPSDSFFTRAVVGGKTSLQQTWFRGWHPPCRVRGFHGHRHSGRTSTSPWWLEGNSFGLHHLPRAFSTMRERCPETFVTFAQAKSLLAERGTARRGELGSYFSFPGTLQLRGGNGGP